MRGRPRNIYDMSDFRGLLHADYKDTIKCAYSKDDHQSTSATAAKNNERLSTGGIFVRNSQDPQQPTAADG